MPITRLTEALDAKGVRYETIDHQPAFTAQGTAAVAHVKGRELAKCVMVKLDGTLAMIVLPSTRKLNFEFVMQVTGAQEVSLASEEEFEDVFPNCETGAMPPFGNLYGVETYVDELLRDDEEIAFNAGTHTELVKMRYEDFELVANPRVAKLSN